MSPLRKKYDEAMQNFSRVLEYPWHDKHFYAAWCAQTYFYSRHVTRILLLAAAHTDMGSPALHKRFSAHSGEEKGHEVLAKNDAKDLGYDVQEIGEFPVTRGFYAHQYYTIEHVNSEALFGWILALEGLAMVHGKKWAKTIKASNSQAPTRFVDVHTDEDPGHVEAAFNVVAGFDAKHTPEIINNMKFTVEMYFQILNRCQEFMAQSAGRKAS